MRHDSLFIVARVALVSLLAFASGCPSPDGNAVDGGTVVDTGDLGELGHPCFPNGTCCWQSSSAERTKCAS